MQTFQRPSSLEWTEFMDWLLGHAWASHRGNPRHRSKFKIWVRTDLDTTPARIHVREEHVRLPAELYSRMVRRGASAQILISPGREHLPKIEQVVELFADAVHRLFRKPRRLHLEVKLENFCVTSIKFRNELVYGPNGPWQMDGPPPDDWREQLGGLLAAGTADLTPHGT